MSSNASFDGGEITIEPPLNYAEIKKAEKAIMKVLNEKRSRGTWRSIDPTTFKMADYCTFNMAIEEYTRETDEGTLTGKRCSRLTTYSYLNGWLNMADEINLIADACPGHNFTGEVIAITEENRSATKVVAKDVCFKGNRATVVHGRVYIKFEDGSTADGNF